MRLSKAFWQSYKENPADAETKGHQLMCRAGLILKMGNGLFTYLPMGLRLLRKIEQIVREELDQIGCFEMLPPFVTPAELWKETNRWDKMGDTMLKAKDRTGKEICLSPTNEESFTDTFRRTVKSYKELPLVLYQIQTKYRDELRPRFGLLRAREFIMKDAYSYHADVASLRETYQMMYQAYQRIFDRMGLKYIAVEADGGAIAEVGSQTHEFQLVADSGEDQLLSCTNPSCKKAWNIESCESVPQQKSSEVAENTWKVLEKKHTGKFKSIDEVSKAFAVRPENTLKSMVLDLIYSDRVEQVLAHIRGCDEVHLLKLQNFYKCKAVQISSPETIAQLGLPKGNIGPLSNNQLKIETIFDKSIDLNQPYVVGACEPDYHYFGYVISKDYQTKANFKQLDFRVAQERDLCMSCGHPLEYKRGIEVGHIFQLGDSYTRAMSAQVLDKDSKAIYPLMGCYGIGVSRIAAAAIEQHHDDFGIKFPTSIAPYHIHFITIGKDQQTKDEGAKWYQLLTQKYEVLWDDREISPGVKFKDADLLGLPLRIVLGPKEYFENKLFEVKFRHSNEVLKIVPGNLLSELSNYFR